MPLNGPRESERQYLEKNKSAFNMVIERYISLAHGLPPPPDVSPYQVPYYSKNKTESTPLSSRKKSLSRLDATAKSSTSPGNSSRQDSCFVEDDFTREVEESLQRRRRQLGLNDDFSFEEVDDDEDDPSWHGSHHLVRGTLSSKLNKKKGRKRKLTVNPIANAVGSSDERKCPKKKVRKGWKDSEIKTPAEQVNLAQNKTAELRQLSFQHRLPDGSSAPRKRGRPLQRKKEVEVYDEDEIPRKRGRLPQKKRAVEVCSEGEISRRGRPPKAKIKSADESNVPRKRGRPPGAKASESQEKCNLDSTEGFQPNGRNREDIQLINRKDVNTTTCRNEDIRSADENNVSKEKGRPSEAEATENQEIHNQDSTVGLSIPIGGGSKGIQPVNRKDETKISYCNGDIRSPDESNIPRKRGKLRKVKAVDNQEIHNQDSTVRHRRPNGRGSKGIQPVNRKDETWTRYSNGDTKEEEEGPPEISDSIMEFVSEAVGESANVLQVICKRKNDILCLIDTLDQVHIMITHFSPSEENTNKETEASTEQISRKDKEKSTEREQSIRTHTSNNVETDTELTEETVRKTTNNKKKKNAVEKQQTEGKTKIIPSKNALEKQQTEGKTKTIPSKNALEKQQTEGKTKTIPSKNALEKQQTEGKTKTIPSKNALEKQQTEGKTKTIPSKNALEKQQTEGKTKTIPSKNALEKQQTEGKTKTIPSKNALEKQQTEGETKTIPSKNALEKQQTEGKTKTIPSKNALEKQQTEGKTKTIPSKNALEKQQTKAETKSKSSKNALEKQQMEGKTKTMPSKAPASEANTEKVGKKRGGSNMRNESSPPHEEIQQSESIAEHAVLKRMEQRNNQGSKHISSAFKSTGKQRRGSSMSIKAPLAAQMSKDDLPLSPGQNTKDMMSMEVCLQERLDIDSDTRIEETTHQFIQHESSNTSKSSTNLSRKTSNSEISNRSLSGSSSWLSDESTRENAEKQRKLGVNESESGLESQDKDEWNATSDEGSTIAELNVRKKNKSFLHHPRKCLKKRKYRFKHRMSNSKVVFDDDDEDDIVIMETPKPVSENKKEDLSSDNSQNRREVQDKPIIARQAVSMKRLEHGNDCWQEQNKRAADRHHGSLTTSSSYIQGLISNSMMKNVQGMMIVSPTKVLGEGQEKEDQNPEDMWHLLQVPPLHQSSFNLHPSRAATINPLGSEETRVAAPPKSATATAITTTTTICDSGITSKASKSMRSFWEMDSDEETENWDSEDTQSLFRSYSTIASVSRLAQESTVLPSYSTLGPERWMAAMRVIQKRKKNSFLRLPLH